MQVSGINKPTEVFLDSSCQNDVKLQGGPKNVSLYFCPYLCQLLIDFQNSFTGTLCGQFAIT